MSMLCWAITSATPIRTIGLCHSVQGTSRQLAGYTGVDYDHIAFWVAGINHQAWFLRFEEADGGDLYPRLRAAMEDPETYAKDPVRFEILRAFGYFPTESSQHNSEYVPYFRRTPELAAKYMLPWKRDYERYVARQEQYYERVKRQGTGEEAIPTDRTNEYCSYVIHSIETNTPFRINANVPNTGLVTSLTDGCCVEVPCLVDNTGIHPCYVGALPVQCATLNRANVGIQQLVVQAALTNDREAVYRAVALDPLTAAVLPLNEARKMTDDLFAASSPWLPLSLR
jgi:alpha-galactosidase